MSKYHLYTLDQLLGLVRNGRLDVANRAGSEIERRLELKMVSSPIIALQVNEYQLEGGGPFSMADVVLCRMPQQQGPDRWAIVEHGFCLSRDGVWVSQPIPSSRDDEFLRRCRFDSAEEAMATWAGGGLTSRFKDK